LKPWLQIIRPVNLVLLMLTQYCIDWFILQPNFTKYGIVFTLNEFQFFLLVLSTSLICAAGYIINDYFDVKIDAVNKPEKQIITKSIAPNTAFNVYLLLNGIGLALGVYLSIVIDYWKLITVFVIVIALLYFYSSTFKKMAFWGNLIVALLAAFSVIIVMLFEPSLYRLARPGDYYAAGLCIDYIIGISFFAFALTMVREIIKDIEDMDGDRRFGANTFPVVYGKSAAVIVASLFIIFTIAGLFSLSPSVLSDFSQIYLYYIAAVSLVLVFTGFKLWTAATKKEFGLLSNLIKITMVIGLGLMFLYYILEF
jgi:4-hydroxybenzoate polyprenyltransferase